MENVNEMFIGPFGSSLKNDCFVDSSAGYCVVYEQKHAIEKNIKLPFRYVTKEKYRLIRLGYNTCHLIASFSQCMKGINCKIRRSHINNFHLFLFLLIVITYMM